VDYPNFVSSSFASRMNNYSRCRLSYIIFVEVI